MFIPPRVEMGDIVYFRRSPESRQECPAIVVTPSEMGALRLTVFNGDSTEDVAGARHQDDPFVQEKPTCILESGVWRKRPTHPGPGRPSKDMLDSRLRQPAKA